MQEDRASAPSGGVTDSVTQSGNEKSAVDMSEVSGYNSSANGHVASEGTGMLLTENGNASVEASGVHAEQHFMHDSVPLPTRQQRRVEPVRRTQEEVEAAERAQAIAQEEAEAAAEEEAAIPYAQTRSQQPHIISQAEYEDFAALTRQISAWMQGMNARFEEMAISAWMQGMNARSEEMAAHMDTIESDMDAIESHMDAIASRTSEMYYMQRLSIIRTFGDEVATSIFDEARALAESSNLRRRTPRSTHP